MQTKGLSRGEKMVLEAALRLNTTDPRKIARDIRSTYALARLCLIELIRRGLILDPVVCRN